MNIGAIAPTKLMRVLRLMLISCFPNLSSVKIFIRWFTRVEYNLYKVE